MKVAYFLSRSLLGKSSPLMIGRLFIWRVLWTSVIRSQIKLFIWKLLHDILPYSAGLISLGMEVDAACRVCGNYEDSGFHILLGCKVVVDVWSVLWPQILSYA